MSKTRPQCGEKQEIVVTWQQQTFSLLPGGACYWQELQTLLVADLHLGREFSFQKVGLSLPTGPSEQCLGMLEGLLDRFPIDHVYILGDLVHARCSLSSYLERQLRRMLVQHPAIRFQLIEGNHDRGALDGLKKVGLECVESVVRNGITLIHDGEGIDSPCISGHLHPGIQLRGEPLRIPCFLIRPQQFLLPAFGELTGTMEVKPAKEDRVYLMTSQQVFPMKAR